MMRTARTLALQRTLALAHRRWRPRRASAQEGYSILLPVPADLPLFFRLAIGTLSRQTLRNANEILVLPDSNVDGFQRLVEAAVPPDLPIPVRYVPSEPWRNALQRLAATPHYNHFTQIVRGIDVATSRYLLLHDADLFLTDPGFVDGQYAEAVLRKLKLLGVSGAKDDWYRQNGFSHVAATWEIIFEGDWARRYRPFELRSGMWTLAGRRRKHDTMLFAQCRTAPDEIDWRAMDDGFVHFNYVICTYREFVRWRHRFQDRRFIIPLLRLLIDRFDPDGDYPEVPAWADIVLCLAGASDRIVFPTVEEGVGKYTELRERLAQFFQSGILAPEEAAAIDERLRPFDRIYGPGAVAGSSPPKTEPLRVTEGVS